MTLKVRNMISRALRVIGVLDGDEEPLISQLNSGLASFNQMTRSLYGNGLGGRLTPVDCIGDDAAEDPPTVNAEAGSLMMAGQGAVEILMPENPRNGDRVGVVDAFRSFSSSNVIVHPNKRCIDNLHSPLTLSTNDDNRIWMFCDHTGNWEKERDLTLDDTPYWSEDVIDALTHMLAGRLCTEYGAPVSETLSQLTVEARATVVRRYGRRGRFQNDAAIGVVSPSTVQRQPAI